MGYNELKLSHQSQMAETMMISSLNQTDIIRSCYAFKSRVKPEDKLVEKQERKLKKKPAYKLQDITDVIGIRFVTLFRLEMPIIFDKLLKLITHDHELSPNPFKENSILEIIFYHTDPNDYLINVLRECIRKHNLTTELKAEIAKEGYSSVHIVTRLNNQVDDLIFEGVKYFIPVEIQIRTVFEDAWGEIDHKYGYANRAGKSGSAPVVNAENVNNHLKVMKKFSDACSEYADAIHSEATNEFGERDTATVIPISPDDDLIELFKTLEVEDKYIETFTYARALRLEAQVLMKADRLKGIAMLLQAKELLNELALNFEENLITPGNRMVYLFTYYVRMNEAICLLSTNVVEDVKEALVIYDSLNKLYPDFVLVKMRLAQAYGKNQLIELSLNEFEQAYANIKQFEQDGCKFADNLPEVDYKHIKMYLPKVYGYQLWRKAEKIEGVNKEQLQLKINILSKAYQLTSESLGHDRKVDIDIYNNLLYYGTEILSLSKESGCEIAADIPKSVDEYLKLLEQAYKIEECDDLDVLDTLLRTYDIRENKESVLKILSKIFPLIEAILATQPWDQDEILELEKFAYRLKEKYQV